MASCIICHKMHINEDHPFSFYTAIQHKITHHTGPKQYETHTSKFGFKKHTYYACDDCVKRYKRYRWGAILGGLLLLPLATLIFRAVDSLFGLFLSWALIGYAAYKIVSHFSIINKAEDWGISERKGTDWKKHFQFSFNKEAAKRRRWPIVGEEKEIIIDNTPEIEEALSNSKNNE